MDPEWTSWALHTFERVSEDVVRATSAATSQLHTLAHTHVPPHVLDAISRGWSAVYGRLYAGVTEAIGYLPNGNGLNANVLTAAIIAGIVAPLFVHLCACVCGCICAPCCGRRRGGTKKDEDTERTQAAEQARKRTADANRGKVFICTICGVDLPADTHTHTQKHAAGKRHTKALAALESAEARADAAVYKWVFPEQLEKLRRKLYGDAASKSQAAGGDAAAEDVPLARRHTQDAAAGVSVVGGNVAVVHAQGAVTGSYADDGWTTVSDKSRKAGAAPTQAGGSAAPGGLAVLRDLVYMEGGRNMLEGCGVAGKFITPAQETAIIKHVDQAIVAAQSGRLRGSTYVPARDGVCPQLHYGVFLNTTEHVVSSARPVEPLPPVLKEIATRILSRADLLGAPAGNKIDAATVFIVEPGMHLPPIVIPSVGIQRPYFLLAVAGTDDVLLGSRIEPLPTHGEFDASFALRTPRRTLVGFDGNVGNGVNMAIAKTSERFIVVLFYGVAPALRAELLARGNIL